MVPFELTIAEFAGDEITHKDGNPITTRPPLVRDGASKTPPLEPPGIWQENFERDMPFFSP